MATQKRERREINGDVVDVAVSVGPLKYEVVLFVDGDQAARKTGFLPRDISTPSFSVMNVEVNVSGGGHSATVNISPSRGPQIKFSTPQTTKRPAEIKLTPAQQLRRFLEILDDETHPDYGSLWRTMWLGGWSQWICEECGKGTDCKCDDDDDADTALKALEENTEKADETHHTPPKSTALAERRAEIDAAADGFRSPHLRRLDAWRKENCPDCGNKQANCVCPAVPGRLVSEELAAAVSSLLPPIPLGKDTQENMTEQHYHLIENDGCGKLWEDCQCLEGDDD